MPSTGFIMVRTQTPTQDGVLEALRQGHFYSSTGPVITDLSVVHAKFTRGNRLDTAHNSMGLSQPALSVHCSPCSLITFYAARSGNRIRRETGAKYDVRRDEEMQIDHSTPGELLDGAVYPITKEQVYLRVECQDEQGRVAWSNPIYVADVLDG